MKFLKVVQKRVSIIIYFLLFFSETAFCGESSREQPVPLKLGVMLTQLGDFSYINNTFTATFWIWTYTNGTSDKILDTIEFVNTVKVETIDSVINRYSRGELIQKRIKGTFYHDWNMKDFPFDKQQLQIIIEDSEKDISSVIFQPDSKVSTFDNEDIKIPGWKIIDMRLASSEKKYKTSFGDARLVKGPVSRYSRMIIEIDMERSDLSVFWKFTASLFAAAAMALISFYIPYEVIIARMGLLVGAIFASVMNLKSVSDNLGTNSMLTLIDKIHIYVLIYIVIAMMTSIYCWRVYNHERNEKKSDKVNLYVGILSTILLSFMVIHIIILGGFHP